MLAKVLICMLLISHDLMLLLNNSHVTIEAKNVIHNESIECLEWDHGFCTEMTNYPNLDKIEEGLIEEYPQLIMDIDDDYFIDDETELRGVVYMEPLCRTSERIIYPKVQNTEIGLLYIINNERLKQGVRIEVCDLDGSLCNSSTRENIARSTCKQFYIYRRLVVMTTTGKTLTHDFQLPSCCKCIELKLYL